MTRRPKWATKSGRLSDAEKAEIERLAVTLEHPTPSNIARRMQRAPDTVKWYMMRNGLLAYRPANRKGQAGRGNFWTAEEDAVAERLRASGKTLRAIGEELTRRFGKRRAASSVQVRLVMLSCSEGLEDSSLSMKSEEGHD